MIAGDIPYILAFLGLAALGFWLVAWRTSRPRPPRSPALHLTLVLATSAAFLIGAVLAWPDRPIEAVLRGLATLFLAWFAWRNWRRERRAKL